MEENKELFEAEQSASEENEAAAQENQPAVEAPTEDTVAETPADSVAEDTSTDAEAQTAQPEVIEGELTDQPAPKKKKGILIGAIAACAVVLVGVVSALAVMGSSPKAKIQAALVATVAENAKETKALQKKFPGAVMIARDGRNKAQKTDFELVMKSFDSPDVDPLVRIFLQGLSGIKLDGSFVTDAPGSTMEFDGKLDIAGIESIDGYFYLSPETVAFNIPRFSDTVLSVNPKQIAADYQNSSVFQTQYPVSEKDLAEMQTTIDLSISMIETINTLDENSKIYKDLTKIINQSMKNVTYEHLGKEDGMDLYRVTVPNSDVTKMCEDIVSYIFFDSELSADLKASIETIPEVTDYKTYVDNEILADLKDNLGYIDIVADLRIEKKIIRQAQVNIFASDVAPYAQELMTAEYANYQVVYNDAKVDGEKTIQIIADEYNGYTIYTITQTVTADQVTMVTKSESTGVTQSMGVTQSTSYTFGKDNSCSINYTQDIGAAEMKMIADGTITADKDIVEIDFPQIDITLNDTYGALTGSKATWGMIFSYHAKVQPIDSPYLIAREHKNIFQMSQMELMQEAQKYEDGMKSIEESFENFFGLS